jgi:hypothetical protein
MSLFLRTKAFRPGQSPGDQIDLTSEIWEFTGGSRDLQVPERAFPLPNEAFRPGLFAVAPDLASEIWESNAFSRFESSVKVTGFTPYKIGQLRKGL